MRCLLVIVFGLLPCLFWAQTSTFDADNENWTAAGDPASSIAAWVQTGGMPGGYARVTDAATGGTWYFVAPPKFLGNKCAAYGKLLRFDQFTSDTLNQQPFGGRPDVMLFSAAFPAPLIFDNAQNPGLAWTHYDIPLLAGAGWHFTDLTGPEPSETEFRAALANVTGLQIRGEYRAQADFGGLDNVILEGEIALDLDADNSSGAPNRDFQADSLCLGDSPLSDADALVFSEKRIDSLVVEVLSSLDGAAEAAVPTGVFPPSIGLFSQNGRTVLVNLGAATPDDFRQAIRALAYRNAAASPSRGSRAVRFQLWVEECGLAATAHAYVPFFPPGNAGLDADTTACFGGQVIDLQKLISENATLGGAWRPAQFFNPSADAAGNYAYIVYGVAGCPNDTARVAVRLVLPPNLGRDTSVCAETPFSLALPTGTFSGWQWSTGSHATTLLIAQAGAYGLTVWTEGCAFSDSLRVAFFRCLECPVFVPNAFRPDDDGRNDQFQAYLGCTTGFFNMEVFDRWGQRVFETTDPEKGWDGTFRGRPVLPGVFVWQIEMDDELRGQSVRRRLHGNLTLLR